MLHAALPQDANVSGLLALLLLIDARRDARIGPAGELIPLADQDRSRWDQAEDRARAVSCCGSRSRRAPPGSTSSRPRSTRATTRRARAAETDWPQILALYGVLRRITDNPVVALNEAVAVAMVHGPQAGLERLVALESDRRIARGHRLAAVRAHLLELAGDTAGAIAAYETAANGTASAPEKHYLVTRAARLTRSSTTEGAAA